MVSSTKDQYKRDIVRRFFGKPCNRKVSMNNASEQLGISRCVISDVIDEMVATGKLEDRNHKKNRAIRGGPLRKDEQTGPKLGLKLVARPEPKQGETKAMGTVQSGQICRQCEYPAFRHRFVRTGDGTPMWECKDGTRVCADEFDPPGKQFLGILPGLNPVARPDGGHPAFLAILDEMRELHCRKAADYGRDADPFANVRASSEFGIPAWVGVMVRAGDKLHRIKSFVKNGSLKNESVADSLMDLAAYSIIALVLLREEAATKEST